ncbi:MAG TPA: hypothetical protein VI566_07840 [Xanthomonadales bacterium]|nr:hypothetical protein [Xanthomonadales bacterium]
MKTNIVLLMALLLSFNAQAYSNFISNPYALFPPGCVTVPDRQLQLFGDDIVKVAEARISLPNARGDNLLPADLAVYRVACADPNRSVIWLEFVSPDYNYYLYETPSVGLIIDGGWRNFRLSREPDTWGVGNGDQNPGTVFGGEMGGMGWETSWIFLLDSDTPLASQGSGWGYDVTAAQYNDSLALHLRWQGTEGVVIDIPSTASVFAAKSLIPLSGRLSGNWVVDGAPDQGFVIAVSELVGDSIPLRNFVDGQDELEKLPLLFFLSWYTFDANGGMLWLTGASQFQMGDTEVTVPIVLVTNGEFLGDKTADREVVGSVTITGNNCNDLKFEYVLTDIGLGSGTKRLQRLFSLETAGYTCRDLEARILSK